ncbi:MAG: carboxypeptidase-like regulatory domain-containing protein [Planctomycetota bacterium]
MTISPAARRRRGQAGGGPRRGEAGPASSSAAPVSTAPTRDEGRAAPLVLSLRDPGGEPLADARLLLHRAEELLADLRADADGRVRRAGAPGRATCLIELPGRALFSREVPLGGQVEVVVPGGAIVGGRVTVAGGLPYREVALELHPGRPVEPELPPAIRALVRPDPERAAVLRTTATPDGRFAFTGLPEDFRGSLALGPGFGFADRESYFHRSLTIEAPREDLELALVALPLVRGRLVHGRDGAPVPFHDVRVLFAAAATGSGTSLGERSDEDGRFAVTVTAPDFADLRLLVPHGGAMIERRPPAVFRDTHDFGDVVLGETETWRFRVVDAQGAPVGGALIASGDSVRTRATDPEGRGRLDDVGPDLRSVTVGAPGFRSRSCEVRLGEEQTIALERANRLVVRLLELPAGLVRPEVVITGPAALLDRGFAETIAFETTGLSAISREGPDGAVRLTASRRPDGVFVFEGLAPEVAFRVEACDLAGQILAARDEVRLAGTEHRELDLAFDAANLRVTRLTVLDPGGRPVPDAEILRRGAEDEAPLFADDEGRAVLVRPRGPGPDLLVSAEGRRPLALADRDVPEGLHEVVLHPAEDD